MAMGLLFPLCAALRLQQSEFMKPSSPSSACPDCNSPRIIVVHEPLVDRRGFLRQTTAAAAAVALAPWARAAEKAKSETLVQQLYGTLNEEQRKAVCFAFDHPRR